MAQTDYGLSQEIEGSFSFKEMKQNVCDACLIVLGLPWTSMVFNIRQNCVSSYLVSCTTKYRDKSDHKATLSFPLKYAETQKNIKSLVQF